MAWDDERVELLKRLWSEGLSASQIAGKMGGVTRNAVIGKVHRLGLSGRATPAKPQRGCSTNGVSDAPTASYAHSAALKPIAPEPEFASPLVLDSGDLTTVSTLKNNMCKWPIGDPATDDFHFCGQSTGTGKSYCPYHAHMAFQPTGQRPPARPQQGVRIADNSQKRRATG